jgi:uncharacterized protein
VNLGKATLKENILELLRLDGVTSTVRRIELITNPRILGYVFNPVSFYFIETDESPLLIAEIGNTFNEIKPYLVRADKFDGESWIFSTVKNFYISPFSSVKNSMTFRIRRSEDRLLIAIDNFDQAGEKEVIAVLKAKAVAWSNKTLLRLFLNYPLSTLKIISAIHYHALKLYLLRVPFWRKGQDSDLQTGVYEWNSRTFQKKDS